MSCSHVVVAEVERGDFGNRGKDGDWTERNEALLALQRLFDEAARLEPPDDREAEPAFDAEAWRALRLPLQSSLKDLRSQLVREACALLVCGLLQLLVSSFLIVRLEHENEPNSFPDSHHRTSA